MKKKKFIRGLSLMAACSAISVAIAALPAIRGLATPYMYTIGYHISEMVCR